MNTNLYDVVYDFYNEAQHMFVHIQISVLQNKAMEDKN